MTLPDAHADAAPVAGLPELRFSNPRRNMVKWHPEGSLALAVGRNPGNSINIA